MDVREGPGEGGGELEDADLRRRRERIADQLVQQAQAQVAGSGRTLLALVLLIAFTWAVNLSPLRVSSDGGGYLRRIGDVKAAQDSLQSSCLTLSAEAQSRARSENEKQKGKAEEVCKKKAADFVARLERLDTSFDLFLLKVPEVHLRWHPLLMMILISLTACYALTSRFQILSLIGEAVTIYRKDMGWKRRHSGILLPALPFWLWPVASPAGEGLGRDECAEYLDLRPREWLRPLLLNVATAALLLIALHVVYVQRTLSPQRLGFPVGEAISSISPYLDKEEKQSLSSHYTSLSYTGSSALDLLILLLVLGPALLLLVRGEANAATIHGRSPRSRWARPLPVGVSRRNLIVLGGAVAGLALVIPRVNWSFPALTARFTRPKARFKRKGEKPVTGLQPGLYARPRVAGASRSGRGNSGPPAAGDRLYHFVRTDGTIGGIVQPINPARFTRAPGLLAFAQGELAWASRFEILERQAIALVRLGEVRAALDGLWNAVLVGSDRLADPMSDLRLYDLIAGFALRYGQRGDLERLIGLTRAHLSVPIPPRARAKQRRARERLPGRIGSWSSRQGEWAGRWLAPAKQWRGFDLPPPAADNR